MPAAPSPDRDAHLACGVDVDRARATSPVSDELPRYRDGGVPAGLLGRLRRGRRRHPAWTPTPRSWTWLVLTDRVMSWAQAMHLAAVAELTCRPETLRGDGPREAAPIRPDGTLVREHAARRGRCRAGDDQPRRGDLGAASAIPLCTQFPGTWTALAAGRIDYLRCTPWSTRPAASPTTRCAPRSRTDRWRAGRAARPASSARRCAVRSCVPTPTPRRPGPNGPCGHVRADPARADRHRAGWTLHLPAEDALAIRLVLDAAAAAMRGPGESRTADQLRAAALAAPFWQALATGQLSTTDGPLDLAVAHGQPSTLDLDLHPDESTVQLRGYGPITPGLGRRGRCPCARWAPLDGSRPPARHRRGRDAAADWPIEPATDPRRPWSATSSTATSAAASPGARPAPAGPTWTTPPHGRPAQRIRRTLPSCADVTISTSRRSTSPSPSPRPGACAGHSPPATSTTSDHPTDAVSPSPLHHRRRLPGF